MDGELRGEADPSAKGDSRAWLRVQCLRTLFFNIGMQTKYVKKK